MKKIQTGPLRGFWGMFYQMDDRRPHRMPFVSSRDPAFLIEKACRKVRRLRARRRAERLSPYLGVE